MTRMTETLPDLTYRYQILKPVTTAATSLYRILLRVSKNTSLYNNIIHSEYS